MGTSDTIILHGKSGMEYEFKIYPLDAAFQDIVAVYVFSEILQERENEYIHNPIYVGQTSELHTRLANHEKMDCILSEQANRIYVKREFDEEMRLIIEEDLIVFYQPMCNEQLK